MFAPIFEDILTLKLINEYHLTHSTIVIVNLIDIWGRYEPPIVQVVEHDHSHEEIGSMWSGCLATRKILAEVYRTIPMYITHNLISPQIQSTPDLYFREEIKNLRLHNDENAEAEMQNMYNDYLIRHGRSEEVNPWKPPDVDKWR